MSLVENQSLLLPDRFFHYFKLMRTTPVFPLVLLLMGSSVQMSSGHTWMFTKGNPNVFVSDAEQLPVLS